MTCIVGLVHQKKVYIGGDSAISGETRLWLNRNPKVFRKDDMLFGCAGSPRMAQLLQYALVIPVHQDGQSIEEYLATIFMDAVRDTFTRGGHAQLERGRETFFCDFLMAYRGRLFEVNNDYQWSEPRAGYTAVGAGARAALGALFACNELDPRLPPDVKLRLALQVSEHFTITVCAPFVIESINGAE